MAILGFELEEIARLLALAEAQGLDEFVFEEEGRFLRIRGPQHRKLIARPAPFTSAAPPALLTPEPNAGPPPLTRPRQIAPPSKADAPPPADQILLTAPMVGVFYRAEKPGAPAFVNVGDTISVGQTIGVIEAMKVFSEFNAEAGGVIVAVPAADGSLVQTGATLFVLRKEQP